MNAQATESPKLACAGEKISRYVVITPARNEADLIEQTIQAMVAQTVTPLRWVIVSDGSTDGTDEIVKRYSAQHPWIHLVRTPERKERHFAGKVMAFNAGYETVKGLDYQIIGSMDADITFDSDYFEFLLARFEENPQLGLGGTPFREGNESYDFRFSSVDHVSGACQIFRRECFEAIGGYTPIKGGGIDVVAVLSARVKGWQTRTFLEKWYQHHRVMGSASYGNFRIIYKNGEKDYVLGNHPLWELSRCLYQMTKSPFLIGGSLMFVGYFWSMLCRRERNIPAELMAFRQADQMKRLKAFVFRKSGS